MLENEQRYLSAETFLVQEPHTKGVRRCPQVSLLLWFPAGVRFSGSVYE